MVDENKDAPSFLRKVARFVANPTTDWADLSASAEEGRESEFAKTEIKAMIERKRRNDFVRKREFDMLRKIRREGLSAGDRLSGLSNFDSEPRAAEEAKPDAAVKAKIDEIEQQMVGESLRRGMSPTARSSSFYNEVTQPAAIGDAKTEPMDIHVSDEVMRAARSAAPGGPAATEKPATAAPQNAHFLDASGTEASEVVHDPELDEAVIAFANADFDLCEKSLLGLIGPSGTRQNDTETWMVLFDLYRATDQQLKFDSLALDFAQRFGQSAPQWFSLPRLVADAAANKASQHTAAAATSIGWVCPARVDLDVVGQLRSQAMQMPYPWVMDWSALANIDAESCHQLRDLLRSWANEPHEMQWSGLDHLNAVLQEAGPSGNRDVDPAYWLLRMEALRLANRPDQFDEAAIDYCMTYEVSPPSWEDAKCTVRSQDDRISTSRAPMSLVSDVSTSFVETELPDEPSLLQMASLELSGQLVGDIGPTLKELEGSLGDCVIVNISCSRLIRVDFIAAGDLLNWVLARRQEQRTIHFEQSNRLVALFFGAMGINEHARVRVRHV